MNNFKGTHSTPTKQKQEDYRGLPLMTFPRVESPLETLSAQVMSSSASLSSCSQWSVFVLLHTVYSSMDLAIWIWQHLITCITHNLHIIYLSNITQARVLLHLMSALLEWGHTDIQYFTGLDSCHREFDMNIHKAGMLRFASIDLQLVVRSCSSRPEVSREKTYSSQKTYK